MSEFRIAFNFEDGVTHFADAAAGEGMVDVAYRRGINIPIDCRDGVCGTCKALLVSGSHQETDELGILDDGEKSAGYFLPCQYKVTSDCVVELAVESTVCSAKRPEKIEARVSDLKKVGGTVYKLSLSADAFHNYAFLPGQYANIHVPGSDRKRSYSFANLGKEGTLEFLVRIIPGGVMSQYLGERAAIGDRVYLEAPFGSFYLRGGSKNIVFIAGGTGVAPVLSMLESISQQGSAADYSIKLLYGARNAEDLVELEAIDSYRNGSFQFSYEIISEVGNTERPGPLGYVTQLLKKEFFEQGEVDIYLCGPPPMVDSTMAWLKANDCQARNIYYERFSPSE